MRSRPAALFLVSLAACGGDDTSTPPFTSAPAVTSIAQTTGSSTGSTSTTSSSGEAAGSGEGTSTGGTALDMGSMPDFGPAKPEGCKGKIDLLFLISRDGTMQHEQAAVVKSVPGFFDVIDSTFADFDYHIMVANPDGDWGGWYCELPEVCGKFGDCGPYGGDYMCGDWMKLTPCEEVVGAGVLFNAGGGAVGHPCDLDGLRYITSEQDDVFDKLQCITKVGVNGDEPRFGDAIIAAMSDEMNGPGGCNEGFLRDDALLFIAIIADGDDQDDSKSKPPVWYDAVVAAKGRADSVVVLGVIPQPLADPDNPCSPYDPDPTNNEISIFGNMFPYYTEGDTCAPDYAPIFKAAAEKVALACEQFIPQ